MLPAWFSCCRCNISYPSSHLLTASMHSYLASAYDFWLLRSPPASVPACSAIAQILTGRRKKKGLLQHLNLSVHTGAWGSLKYSTAVKMCYNSYNDVKLLFCFFCMHACMHFVNACNIVLQYIPNCTLLSFLPTFFLFIRCAATASQKLGYIRIQKQSTIRSGVFNQLFIQYFNDQSAWGDQRLGSRLHCLCSLRHPSVLWCGSPTNALILSITLLQACMWVLWKL